jgi:hypothetical protein
MNETLLGLVAAYVLFTALLLLALIHSRLHWFFKAALLVLALGFYWISYAGWRESRGWPSPTALPQKFLLHYAVIEEPDRDRGDDGAIFIWLSDLEHDRLADQPRAYRIGYRRETHANLEDAIRKMRYGKLQLGSVDGMMPAADGPEEETGSDLYPNLRFIDLPDPALPEK